MQWIVYHNLNGFARAKKVSFGDDGMKKEELGAEAELEGFGCRFSLLYLLQFILLCATM